MTIKQEGNCNLKKSPQWYKLEKAASGIGGRLSVLLDASPVRVVGTSCCPRSGWIGKGGTKRLKEARLSRIFLIYSMNR